MEVQKYGKSTVEGIVENIFFRGDYFEVRVRAGDTFLTVKRAIDESRLAIGELVDVFLYKIFCNCSAGLRIYCADREKT